MKRNREDCCLDRLLRLLLLGPLLLPPNCSGTAALPAYAAQYTFRLRPGQQPLKTKSRLTMSPLDGVWVTVHRRG